MTVADKMEMCADALEEFSIRFKPREKTVLFKNKLVGQQKLYEVNPLYISIPDDTYRENMDPKHLYACECPTRPVIYLKGRPSETYLRPIVDTRNMQLNDKIRDEVTLRFQESPIFPTLKMFTPNSARRDQFRKSSPSKRVLKQSISVPRKIYQF